MIGGAPASTVANPWMRSHGRAPQPELRYVSSAILLDTELPLSIIGRGDISLATKLRPVKESSLSARVLDALKDAIFSGKFKPGDALRELHVARDLQVSQDTVREALMQLVHMGLVTRVENKETIVTKLSDQEVRERVNIRATLEALACVEASRRMTKKNFDELNEILKIYSRAVSRRAYHEAGQADLQFHRYIWHQAGNRTLYRMLDQLAVPLFAFVSLLHSSRASDLKTLVDPHAELVSALKKGQPRLIEDTIRGHIVSFYSKFLDSAVEDSHAHTG
jgi:DNA-binding GntR family transcriptional regulator